jgi:taurine dioxygenase
VTELIATAAGITIARLAGNIGAELGGIDLASPLDRQSVAAIRAALLEHKVIFFRDQDLDYHRQQAFARRLGDLTLGHPIYQSPESRPALREMDSSQGTRANHWHTDLTFIERPPAFCLLHAKIIPRLGGDTMWANCVTGYRQLPAGLRDLADRLRIVHSNDSDYTQATVSGRRDYLATAYETEHPAVRVHPETGEKALLLGGFARSVAGYPPAAGRDMLRLLEEYAARPENTVRWRWRAGDLAVWDNQATMHYAIHDYGTARRRLERLSTVGSVPVGPDGRPSVVLSGDTSRYSAGSYSAGSYTSGAA